jgi:hypothetical protein
MNALDRLFVKNLCQFYDKESRPLRLLSPSKLTQFRTNDASAVGQPDASAC